MGYNRLQSYYRKIKYIIQDSYFESSSNVSIEGLFNGCKIINKVLEIERKYYINRLFKNKR